MPSKFEESKPNPAIRRKTMRARANMQDTKGERGIVVAGSLAATIAAWVLLSLPGSPTSTPGQVSDTNQAAVTVTAQTADAFDTSASSSLQSLGISTSIATSTATSTPLASLASGAAASQATDSSQSATTSQVTTSSSSVQSPQAVASTRTSR